MRWSWRSTQADAAAGQELRALGLSAGVPAASASDVARGFADDTSTAAARPVACSARASGITRDAPLPGGRPPCQPAAVVPATSRKAKTAVSR